MKKILAKKPLVALVLLLALGGVGWVSRTVAADDDTRAVTSTFKIEGMTCGGCELGVKMTIKKLDGVESVEASYEDGEAEVVYDPKTVTPEDIIAAIEDLGYSAKFELPKHPSKDGGAR